MSGLMRWLQNSALARRRLLTVWLLVAAPTAFGAGADALFAATLTDLDDKPFAMESLRGKPLIVNFWARWCGPCRVEIPELAKVQAKHKSSDLVVVGIGIEEDTEPARDFAKAYDMDYRVVLGKKKGTWLMQVLGNSRAGLPFTVVIDRKGEIVSRKLGLMSAAELDAAAASILK